MRANYRPIVNVLRQMSSQTKNSNSSKPKGSSKKTTVKTETSEAPTETSSGQIDDGIYRSPEYYSHNTNSFYDHMLQMSKYRLTQPSNKS